MSNNTSLSVQRSFRIPRAIDERILKRKKKKGGGMSENVVALLDDSLTREEKEESKLGANKLSPGNLRKG